MSKDAEMRTRLTLRAGDPGTKGLQTKYGDRLLAVRYRYDEARGVRIKTAEIIVDEMPWTPRFPAGCNPDELVLVRVDYAEMTLRQQIKDAGGLWEPQQKAWRLRLAVAYGLGLESRVVY